jgi:hypothetical protein
MRLEDFLWVEGGYLKTRAKLTPEQTEVLKLHKPELMDRLTNPPGTLYLWRRKRADNVAGWHILYSDKSIEWVQHVLGEDKEVRIVERCNVHHKNTPATYATHATRE